MAISQPPVQTRSVEGTGAASVALAFSSNVTAGNTIIADATGFNDTMGTGSVTDSRGNSYTRVDSKSNTSARAAIYYATNVAAGATTVTLNTGIGVDKSLAIHEYSGMATASTFDVTAATGGTGTSATHTSGTTGTTGQANELVHLVSAHEGTTGAVTAGAGYTLRESQTSATHMPIATEEKIVSSTGTQSGTFTWVNAAYAVCIATFKDATPGGGGATGPPVGSFALLGVGT